LWCRRRRVGIADVIEVRPMVDRAALPGSPASMRETMAMGVAAVGCDLVQQL
jgi:hypothetical protein